MLLKQLYNDTGQLRKAIGDAASLGSLQMRGL
jgi:hypothetical protein